MRTKSSTRMENFAQTEPHEKDQNPETKRTEKKAVNFSLTEAQGPESGPNIQERMRIKSSTRMEKLRQTRPTTVTKETKNHPAAKDQDGMKLGDDKLVWMTPKDESESEKKCDNMKKVGIRPSGNTSLGRNNRKTGANISDRMNNEREPEPNKQDMDPPGLT